MVWILYGYSHSSAEETEAKRGDMVKVRARVRTALCATRQLAGRTDGDPPFVKCSLMPRFHHSGYHDAARTWVSLFRNIGMPWKDLIAIQRAHALTDDPILRKPTMASIVSVDGINWVKTCPPTA